MAAASRLTESADFGALDAQLLATARRLVGPRDAEDLVQDTWAAAQRSIRDPVRGSMAAWMMTILRSRAVDEHRRRQRRGAALALLVGQVTPATGDPADEVAGAELWRQCLAQVTPREREALRLVYGEGLTHAEAAAKLGVCPHVVATRTAAARKRLKKCLFA